VLLESFNVNRKLFFNLCYYIHITDLDGLILKPFHNRKDVIVYHFYYGRHNGEITEATDLYASKFVIGETKQFYHNKNNISYIVITVAKRRSLTVYEKCQFKPKPP